jgi:hypothetical protein
MKTPDQLHQQPTFEGSLLNLDSKIMKISQLISLEM